MKKIPPQILTALALLVPACSVVVNADRSKVQDPLYLPRPDATADGSGGGDDAAAEGGDDAAAEGSEGDDGGTGDEGAAADGGADGSVVAIDAADAGPADALRDVPEVGLLDAGISDGADGG